MQRIPRGLIVCLASIATAIVVGTSFADDYALVVGVNWCPKYLDDIEDKKGKPYLPLEGAEADATAFASLLQTQYHFSNDHIECLLGEKATFKTISELFASLQHKLTSKDQLVFYFAGHGTQVPDEFPYDGPYDEQDQDGLDEALCPADASREIQTKNGVQYNMASNVIVDDTLDKWLQGIKAARITLVLDCCHAGTAIKGIAANKIRERSLPITLLHAGSMPSSKAKSPWHRLQSNRKGSAKAILALYACGADQSAIERSFTDLDGDVRGQFTKLLIDYLKRNNGKGSAAEISASLKANIVASAQNQARGSASGQLTQAWQRARDQNPSFESNGVGQSALILPAKSDGADAQRQAAPSRN